MYRCKNGEIVDTPMIDEVLSEGFNYSNFIFYFIRSRFRFNASKK